MVYISNDLSIPSISNFGGGGLTSHNNDVVPALLVIEETSPSAQNVTMTNGQRYAVGIAFNRSVSQGEDVVITVADGVAYDEDFNLTLNSANIENKTSNYSEHGVVFTYTGVTGTVSVSVVADVGSSAVVEGLIIREQDAVSGTVSAYGAGAHSGPQAIVYNGKLLQCFAELYTGTRYLAYDGSSIGALPIPSKELDDNDTYHQSMALAEVDGGLAFVATDHNGQLQYIWASTPAGLTSATPADFDADNVVATYVRLVSFNDILVCITRSDTSDAVGGRMYLVVNMGSTPIIVTDVLFNSPVRLYPRNWFFSEDDAGNPLLMLVMERRIGSTWEGCAAAIYDVSNNQWYDINGQTRGSNSYGTSGTPRWTQGILEGMTASDAGLSIVDAVTDEQVYVGGDVAFRINEWNGTTKKADIVIPFVQTDNADEGVYEPLSELRLHVQSGTTSVVTDADTNPFDLQELSTYRLDFDCKWDGDNVKLYLTERRRRRWGSHRFDEDYYNPYMDWGATRLSEYTITAPVDAANSAALVSAVSKTGVLEFSDSVLGSNNASRLAVLLPRWVDDDKRYLSLHVAQNELHSDKRQMQMRIIDTTTAFSATDPEDSRFLIGAMNPNSSRHDVTLSDADSTQCMINFICNPFSVSGLGLDRVIIRAETGGTFRFVVDFDDNSGGGGMRVLARTAGGTDIINVRGTDTYFGRTTGWVNVLIGIDLSQTASADRIKIYINDVKETLTVTTATKDATVAFNGAVYSLLERDDATRDFVGDVARIFMYPDQWVDLDTESNRRLFHDAYGKPVDLGATGATPLGSQPPIFFEGDETEFATNKGSVATSMTGTFTAALSRPTDYSVRLV